MISGKIFRPWFTSRTSQIVKTPKIYFCDVGFAAHLLGISTPAQMNRDPLMGNIFENMIVMEAVKAHYNAGKSNQLYYFRNSNGLEVDLLVGQQRKLIPYEIKSGRTMDSKQTMNLKKFISKYPDDIAEVGGVIYCGDLVDIALVWSEYDLVYTFVDRPLLETEGGRMDNKRYTLEEKIKFLDALGKKGTVFKNVRFSRCGFLGNPS